MRSILIATDGSTGSDVAVAAGLELARESGADVTYVYVREPITALGEPFYQETLTAQQHAAREALDSARSAGESMGILGETEIMEGQPAHEILALAKARDVDMIVVGSRGLGALAGALLGSTSSAVVRGADRPVLVVKEGAGAQGGSERGEERVSAP
ncbi:MAG TPA: universal stress protein [Gaiellaceae bacterium]|nr:universal stress protein [Gaiellaceae bacterium]